MPTSVAIVLEPGDEADHVEALGEAAGLTLQTFSGADGLLLHASQQWPEIVVLPLGTREEETVLVSRALRKRAGLESRTLTICLLTRGGTLVESDAEAVDAGADSLLAFTGYPDLVQTLCKRLGIEPAPSDDDVILVTEFADGDTQGPAFDQTPILPKAATLADIRLKLDEVRYADYFVVLGAGRTATSDELAAAVVALRHRFDPGRVSDPRIVTAMEEILDGIHDAWLVLGDSKLRRRYLEHLPDPGQHQS